MRYQPLFHIALQHTYYPDMRCADFMIAPSEETVKTMRAHRLLVNSFTNGLSLLTSMAADKPLIDVSADTVFSFELKLKNPLFYQFTDIADDKLKAYINKGKSLNLQPDSNLTDAGDVGHDAFGVIRIKNLSFKKDAPTFTLGFESKKVFWNYLLVTDDETDGFVIEHDAVNDSKIVFKKPEAPGAHIDKMLLRLLEQDHPTAKKIVITSKEPAAYFKGGRQKIRLKKDNVVLVAHLPNPRPEEGEVKVIKYFKNQKI